MRHAGVLSALLLTAALMCAMPGIVRMPAAERVSDSLRPPTLRTLTVWLMPGQVGDRKLINGLCTAFEKQYKGTRIFLRVVTADELTAENAVLPDVALFETGEIAQPQSCFLPLESDLKDTSGVYAGVRRAIPLWLSPNVLSMPQEWFEGDAAPQVRGESLLAVSTPEPAKENTGTIAPEDLPWAQLIRPGALKAPQDAGWQQLLAACPEALWDDLLVSLSKDPSVTPTPAAANDEWCTTLPKSIGTTPTPMPPIGEGARVETLQSYQQRLKGGSRLCMCMPLPAISSHVRYAALCRDDEDARAFLLFLQENAVQAAQHGLLDAASTDLPLLLPNAFAHTRQEIATVCQDGFARLESPVTTLLRLQ